MAEQSLKLRRRSGPQTIDRSVGHERDVLIRYQAGDPHAATELIGQYRRFIAGKAHKAAWKANHDLSEEDLFQEGVVGLLEAADRWDPAKQNRFLTYAWHWIRHEMLRAIQAQGSTVRVPVHVHEMLRNVYMGKRAATEQERRALDMLSVESIDAPIEPDSDRLLGEVLPCPDATPEEMFSAAEHAGSLQRAIASGLRTLNARERLIIKERFLRDDSEAQQDLADALGVSRARVGQIEDEALAKLRRHPALRTSARTDGSRKPLSANRRRVPRPRSHRAA